MDSYGTSKFDPEQLKSAVLRAFDALWDTGLWMDEISDLLEQSTLCQEKLLARALARALAQMQINISDAILPSNQNHWHRQQKTWGWTQYLWTLQPWVLLTLCLNLTPVIMGCASATSTQVIRRISISSSFSLSQDSLSNSHFPGTKSLISTTKLLPNLLKDSFEPHSAKCELQDFIQVDPPVFINWLPGGSAKTRPTGHRRGRPPRTDFEHSWQKVLLSLYDGRRRGRPPRQVLPWSHRPKGHRRGRPPNNYSSLETPSLHSFLNRISWCFMLVALPAAIGWWCLSSPNHTPLFKGGGGVVNA